MRKRRKQPHLYMRRRTTPSLCDRWTFYVFYLRWSLFATTHSQSSLSRRKSVFRSFIPHYCHSLVTRQWRRNLPTTPFSHWHITLQSDTPVHWNVVPLLALQLASGGSALPQKSHRGFASGLHWRTSVLQTSQLGVPLSKTLRRPVTSYKHIYNCAWDGPCAITS